MSSQVPAASGAEPVVWARRPADVVPPLRVDEPGPQVQRPAHSAELPARSRVRGRRQTGPAWAAPQAEARAGVQRLPDARRLVGLQVEAQPPERARVGAPVVQA